MIEMFYNVKAFERKVRKVF